MNLSVVEVIGSDPAVIEITEIGTAVVDVANFAGPPGPPGPAGGATNVGRNLIHNPLFNIAQRGVGPWTAGGYSADRWSVSNGGDTASFSLVALSDADRGAIGDEAAGTMLQNVFTGNVASGAYNFLFQRVENLRRLSGKTITVSFWAKALAGTPKLGINLSQNFGTGGSPSSQVISLATGNTVTLTTAWARYSSTISVPSAAGKTFGTNGDDNSQLELFFSSSTSLAARAGNIGVQSGTIQLWGVQLEIGSVATPLEKPDPQQDLAKCQRFASIVTLTNRAYAPAAGAVFAHTVTWPQPMRATPTSTALSGGSSANISSATLNLIDARNGAYTMTAIAAGDALAASVIYLLSADL